MYDYPPPNQDVLKSILTATLNRCWQELCFQGDEILIIEYPFLPIIVKQTIHDVLLQKFGRELSVMPTPIATTLSFGSKSGLVIDMGYLETRVYLVYDGRLMENLTGFYPIGTQSALS